MEGGLEGEDRVKGMVGRGEGVRNGRRARRGREIEGDGR